MNTYSTLVPKKIKVPTQFDYSYIADRQCSYFCLEAIKNKDKFYDLHKRDIVKLFQNLYINCIMRASIKKRNSKDRPDVETLFNPNVLGDRNVKLHKMIRYPERISEYWETRMSNTYPNYIEVETEKLGFDTLPILDLYKIIKTLRFGEYVAINRHVMSFVIIRYSNEEYLILDPHYTTIALFSLFDVMKYILEGRDYSLITIMYDISTHERWLKIKNRKNADELLTAG